MHALIRADFDLTALLDDPRFTPDQVIAFLSDPDTQAKVADIAKIAHLGLTIRAAAARHVAIDTLEHVAKTTDDLVEKRRAATALFRATASPLVPLARSARPHRTPSVSEGTTSSSPVAHVTGCSSASAHAHAPSFAPTVTAAGVPLVPDSRASRAASEPVRPSPSAPLPLSLSAPSSSSPRHSASSAFNSSSGSSPRLSAALRVESSTSRSPSSPLTSSVRALSSPSKLGDSSAERTSQPPTRAGPQDRRGLLPADLIRAATGPPV